MLWACESYVQLEKDTTFVVFCLSHEDHLLHCCSPTKEMIQCCSGLSKAFNNLIIWKQRSNRWCSKPLIHFDQFKYGWLLFCISVMKLLYIGMYIIINSCDKKQMFIQQHNIQGAVEAPTCQHVDDCYDSCMWLYDCCCAASLFLWMICATLIICFFNEGCFSASSSGYWRKHWRPFLSLFI